MGLAQVDKEIVTSNVATVNLTTINSDDVYMVVLSGVTLDTDGQQIYMRVTTGGTADSDSEYDKSSQVIRSNTTTGTTSDENESSWRIQGAVGNSTGEADNHIIYLFNFNASDEYSYYTNDSVCLTSSAYSYGYKGGGYHTIAESNDCVEFFVQSSNNFNGGSFTLYRITS